MFKKSSIILGAMLMGAMPMVAEQLSPEAALTRALAEANAPANRLSAPAVKPDMKLTYTASAEGINEFYVFANEGNGFCIVAADDVVSTPILGYSDSGTFDAANIPANMKWFLDGYAAEIKAMIAKGSKQSAPTTITTFAATERHDVAPLCKTKWNQDEPYYDMCPTKDGRHAYTGCVATAVAQIMKVHEWPETGTGKLSYSCTGFGLQTVDFSQSHYDWANMLNTYDASATDAQKEAVAKLMYDVGVSARMMYGLDGSGAVSNDAVSGLINYFRYGKGIRSLMRETFFYDEFVDIVYQEVAAGRPVLCGGSNYSGGGHAFVVDGFRAEGNYFHLNWGWGGMSDGYFLINGLDPDSQGAGGSTAGYTMGLMAIVGIQPDKDQTSDYSPYMFENVDFSTAATSYDRTQSIQFLKNTSGQGIFNYTPTTLNAEMGVRLVNEESGETTYISGGAKASIRFQYGCLKYLVNASLFPTDGNYIVTPAYKWNDQWYDVYVNIGCIQSLRCEASNMGVKFTPVNTKASVSVSSLNVPSEVYLNRPFQVTATLNATGGEYYAQVALVLLQGNQAISMLDLSQVDILDGDSKTLSWTPYLPDQSNNGIPAGNYKLGLYRYTSSSNLTALSFNTPTITVYDEPALRYNLSGYKFDGSTSNGGSASNPALVNPSNFGASANLKVTSGYFSDLVMGLFLDTSGNVIGTTSQKFCEAQSGEEITINITGDYSGILRPDTKYRFQWYGTYTGAMGTARNIKAETSALDNISAEGVVSLYPNPVETTLNIAAPTEIAGVELFSLNGAMVANFTVGAANAQLDLSGLTQGMYIARVKFANGTTVNRQIIKK